MPRYDGRTIERATKRAYDVVVIGSGPAGAAVAKQVTESGATCAVIESGHWYRPDEFAADGFSAMARYYRDLGAAISFGNCPMPIVQGCAVGGTSVINGAISWRLPQDIYAEWLLQDPELEAALPWSELEAITDQIERDLNIHPTPDNIAGANNLLLAKGAAALGIEHRPISRNVRNCRGLGRCLQGCPEGNKQSMDRSYLLQAETQGADIFSGVSAHKIVLRQKRAVAVEAVSASNCAMTFTAKRAVVVAASAIQSPMLLWRSGIRQGPVGEYFQAHPGVSVAGRFADPVRMWEGATQGHEAIGMRKEGIKFEALGYDLTIVASRLKGIGMQLAAEIGDIAHWANWGAAIRAAGRGTVKPGFGGRAKIHYNLTPADIAKFRRGIAVLAEMMLAAGAQRVGLGVYGWDRPVTTTAEIERFSSSGPLQPKAYMAAATHLFGTCRMGSRPESSVVRPDFRHHHCDGLYMADSSVFPSNTGVNPQTSILAMATICGKNVART